MNALQIGDEEIQSITTDIWTTYVSPDSVVIAAAPGSTVQGSELNAAVRIAGGASALVVVGCDSDSARNLASRLFDLPGADAVEDADMTDALGEMANVVGGNVKSLSTAPSTLTLPVVSGRTAASGDDALCSVEVIWDEGRAIVTVWPGGRQENTTNAMEAPQ